jgi:hypothetical protein
LKIWWNFFYVLFSIKNVADVNSIDSFVSKRNMEEFSVVIKREVDQDPELESLSDWVRTIRSLVQGRIHKLKNCVNSRPKSVFKDQEAVKCLSS